VPRYFFDTSDGAVFIRDREGIELENLEAAKAEATTILLEVAIDELPRQQPAELCCQRQGQDRTGGAADRAVLGCGLPVPHARKPRVIRRTPFTECN
jgi:hypothetical protein